MFITSGLVMALSMVVSQGFAADGPSPAVAPFDAAEAERHQQMWAEHLGVPRQLTNSVGMKFVLIPPGEFSMGSPPSETGHDQNEQQHTVRITRAFYLGVHEVTVQQYRAVVELIGYRTEVERRNDERAKSPLDLMNLRDMLKKREALPIWKTADVSQTDAQPVVCIARGDAMAFTEWLSKTEERAYRLPTEAEWEYACRAGTTTSFHFGQQLNGIAANCNGKLPYGTAASGPYVEGRRAVGAYPPNAFGLRDMHGNVAEWCQDWYDRYYYRSAPRDDPPGPAEPTGRAVVRGGGWWSYAKTCRAAFRGSVSPHDSDVAIGFRIVLDPSTLPVNDRHHEE